MKRKFFSAVLAVAVLFCALPLEATATDVSSFRYEIIDGEVKIKDYRGQDGNVVIPSEIEGYPVTAIGEKAFDFCESLKSLVIPNGVTSIGEKAFYYCTSLEKIEIPRSITEIGDLAFHFCSSVTEIQVAEDNAVYYSEGNCLIEKKTGTLIRGCITSVIPNGVTKIEYCAFYGCKLLPEITIPDSVTSIGNEAFVFCESLTTITIPKSVMTVEEKLFLECENLVDVYCEAETKPENWHEDWSWSIKAAIHWGDGSVEFPIQFNYVIENEEVTISSYYGLEQNVVIPSEIDGYPVTKIANNAFDNNGRLLSVVIPDSVTELGEYAFVYCGSLSDVTLPKGLKEIKSGTFWGCRSLTEIDIPDSVTEIGDYAFNKTGLTSLRIPDQITKIGEEAYSETALKEVFVGGQVESMGKNVFVWCEELADIYCEAESKPAGWSESWLGDCNATVHWGAKPLVTYGDADGDGEINGLDVTRLMKYFVSVNYADGSCSVELADGADCNGDGVIDGRDVVRLLRYLADFDPTTGTSSVALGK